jgi:hypothetical protein
MKLKGKKVHKDPQGRRYTFNVEELKKQNIDPKIFEKFMTTTASEFDKIHAHFIESRDLFFMSIWKIDPNGLGRLNRDEIAAMSFEELQKAYIKGPSDDEFDAHMKLSEIYIIAQEQLASAWNNLMIEAEKVSPVYKERLTKILTSKKG